MKVTSAGIINGKIQDKYGKRGTQKNAAGIPTYSLPLKFEDAPAGTVTYAFIMEDRDAVPVCGYSWIHWCAANIRRTELLENESITATDYVQGTSSDSGAIAKIDRGLVSTYTGMAPPDKPHTYTIHVFALDTALPLERGFYMNELYHAMDGHVLAYAKLEGVYDN